MIDDRLAMTITHSDGSEDRWGPDEPDGRDIPDDLTFSTSIPGGFKDLSCTLNRDLDIYSDEQLFDNVLVYGAGRDPIWEGRMMNFPRDGQRVTPTASGHISHLTDDPTACEVYIDRDLTRWTDWSTTRRQYWVNFPRNVDMYNWSVLGDTLNGVPAISMQAEGVLDAQGLCEVWYDAGAGNKIARVRCVSAVNEGWAYPDGNIYLMLTEADDDAGNGVTGGAVQSANYAQAAARPLDWSPASAHRYVFIQHFTNTINHGVAGTIYGYRMTQMNVIGDHGLTLRGSSVSQDGFFVSDIVEDIIKRWAPLLNYTYPGSIEQTVFVVPHFVQYTMTTGYDMLSQVNAFELMDWGCYSGGEEGWPSRTFFFRQPSPERLTWRARISDGHSLTSEGVQGTDIFNGVIVNFTTPDNVSHTAGPVGSGAEYMDSSLVDTDPTNPVNMWGIPRKYGQLNVTRPTTPAGAIQLGAIWLSRRLGVQKRGTLNVRGWVKHPSGAYYPAARMRSGDYVIVEDDPRDTEPRKIVNTNYTHRDRAINCDLEHEAFRIDAMMERYGVELVGVT